MGLQDKNKNKKIHISALNEAGYGFAHKASKVIQIKQSVKRTSLCHFKMLYATCDKR